MLFYMQQLPRVLVISNECFSIVTSNGRTLRNFFEGWPKSNLAQFHIRNTAPDYTVCNKYYYVSDRAALASFIKKIPVNGQQLKNQMPSHRSEQKAAGRKRNAISMMFRNMIWNSMRWAGDEFYCWVEEFKPELVLLQAGDCGFMLRLARKISEKFSIPLVIYNSEGYFFKKKNYFDSPGITKVFYPIFHWLFCREFEKTVKIAERSIYCCDKLKADYDKRFALPSDVIYTATEVVPERVETKNNPLRISYLGNLGVGRHSSLAEIGEVLQKISPELKLDIYGKIPNQQVERAFEQCLGIAYHGFISYEEVVDVIHRSDILIHAESFSDFSREDLKYAFSTKIADSLASGRCFLVYAPENMACSEYLKENKAAYVVDRYEDLLPVLEMLCSDSRARSAYLDNALRLVEKRHNGKENAKRFREILCECIT